MLKNKIEKYTINNKDIIIKKTIELIVTYKCNMKCSYCYEKDCNKIQLDNTISNDTILKAISFIYQEINNINLSEDEYIDIQFWGGEPLLNVNTIDIFIQEFSSNKKIGYFKIHTNGSLIIDNIDMLLKWKSITNNRLIIGVSYDYEPLQYVNRQHSNKKIVRNSIKVLDYFGFNYLIKTTMFHKDLENNLFNIYKDYILFRKLLKKENYFLLAIDTTKKTKCNINNVKYEFDKILDYIVKNNISISGFFSWDKNLTNRIKCRSFTNNLVCIDLLSESLYCCQGAVFHPKHDLFKYGSLNDSYEKISNSISIKTSQIKYDETCEKCQTFCRACPIDSVQTSLVDYAKIIQRDNHCDVYALIDEYRVKFRKFVDNLK